MILTLTENQVLILTEYNEAAEDELLLKHKIRKFFPRGPRTKNTWKYNFIISSNRFNTVCQEYS